PASQPDRSGDRNRDQQAGILWSSDSRSDSRSEPVAMSTPPEVSRRPCSSARRAGARSHPTPDSGHRNRNASSAQKGAIDYQAVPKAHRVWGRSHKVGPVNQAPKKVGTASRGDATREGSAQGKTRGGIVRLGSGVVGIASSGLESETCELVSCGTGV